MELPGRLALECDVPSALGDEGLGGRIHRRRIIVIAHAGIGVGGAMQRRLVLQKVRVQLVEARRILLIPPRIPLQPAADRLKVGLALLPSLRLTERFLERRVVEQVLECPEQDQHADDHHNEQRDRQRPHAARLLRLGIQARYVLVCH